MTTSTTTFKDGVWITKTTDVNGNVVTSISDIQPSNATPNTEQCDANTGTATAETVDKPFVSNQCKGVIYTTENLVDKKTGKSIKIKRDANGMITPESQKELDKVQEARSEKILANNRKIQEARDKVNAEKAAEAANEKKRIGGKLELNITLPNGTNLIDISKTVGHEKTDTSVSAEIFDLTEAGKKKVDVENVRTPGIKFGVGVTMSDKAMKDLGLSVKQRGAAVTVDKAKEAFDAEAERLGHQSVQDKYDGKTLQEINDARASETAENLRNLGKKVGNELLK